MHNISPHHFPFDHFLSFVLFCNKFYKIYYYIYYTMLLTKNFKTFDLIVIWIFYYTIFHKTCLEYFFHDYHIHLYFECVQYFIVKLFSFKKKNKQRRTNFLLRRLMGKADVTYSSFSYLICIPFYGNVWIYYLE
jgi:hypothetical protein